MVTCAEEGDHAVQGAVLRPVEAERADRVHLEFHGGWERGVIPDGVDDDVGDRIERAVAVAGREQAAVEAGAELAGRQPGKCLEVKPMDRVLKRPLESRAVKAWHAAGRRETRNHEGPCMPQAFTTVVGRLRRSVEQLGEVAEAGRGGVCD